MLLHELKRQVVITPHDANARFALGEALFGEGDVAAATRQLEKAVELDAGHANATRLLARCYAAEQRMALAERILRESVERQPRDPQWRDELASVLMAVGRMDDALMHLHHATHLQPGNAARLVTMAKVHLSRKQPESAYPLLEEATRLAPGDPAIEQLLRDVATMLGRSTVTRPVRDRDFLLGRTLLSMEQRAVDWESNHGQLKDFARCLRERDAAAARRALVTAEGVPAWVVEFLKGELLAAEGDAVKAIRAFSRCAESQPDLVLAWSRLGELHELLDAHQEAQRCCERVVQLDPRQVEAWERLGNLHRHAGRTDAARTSYQRATELEPGGTAAMSLDALLRDSPAGQAQLHAPGRIGALGWNACGGLVSPVEAVAIPGSGKLLFSGNVGPEGRDAAQVVHSCLLARAQALGVTHASQRDLHIHFTDTEFSKDGPSAGLALFLAGLSALRDVPLLPMLAASGELTLHGAIKPVGGIHEKLVAAALTGITCVILPRRNLFNARELPPEVRQRVRIHYVDHVTEAVPLAFPTQPTGSASPV